MTDLRSSAIVKWREYAKAAKAYKDPIYKDLQKVYNQVKNGQKVIDIGKVIAKGGLLKTNPRLAIAPIGVKNIFCTFFQNGTIHFKPDNNWRRRSEVKDVILPSCLPAWSWTNPENRFKNKNLQAPVPPVPPRFLPKVLTDDYYILWEVDEWKMIPPTDPYLLRRITKTMFVVLAGWDLTDIEKSAMAGRMA